MEIRKLLYTSVIILFIFQWSPAQEFDIRLKLDESNCLPNTACYFVQIRSSNQDNWNLASQNYRIFYDGSKATLKEEASTSLLPSNRYSSLLFRERVDNVDASALSKDLPFAENMSFINYSIDLSNLTDGGIKLPMAGGWLLTSKLCFDLTEEASAAPDVHLDMVWGRKGKTDSYAPAYVAVSEWLESYSISPAQGKTYGDLNDSTGVVPTKFVTIEKQDILCHGDFGSIDLTYHRSNSYEVKINGDHMDLDRIPAGTHELILSDQNGCEYREEFEIAEPENLEMTIVNSEHPKNLNSTDGLVNVDITGGVQPYIYEWTGDNDFYSAEQNLNNLSIGEYQLKVMDANGCETSPLIITMDALTNIEEVKELSDIQIFPNPVKDILQIQNISSDVSIKNLEVYDLRGILLKSEENIPSFQRRIKMDDVTPGIYILRLVLSDNNSLTRKFIKV